MNTAARKLLAEFVGTFLLVFLAVGAAIFGIAAKVGADGNGPGNGVVGVALAFGLVLLGIAYAFGPISGAHVNPAVTLGMLLGRRMPTNEAVGYWIAQFLGAIVARRRPQAVRLLLRRHRLHRWRWAPTPTTTAPSTWPAPSSSRPCSPPPSSW